MDYCFIPDPGTFTGRPLVGSEIALLTEVFGTSLNCTIISIGDSGNPYLGRALNDRLLLMPSGTGSDIAAMPFVYRKLFVHECAHIWQMQHGLRHHISDLTRAFRSVQKAFGFGNRWSAYHYSFTRLRPAHHKNPGGPLRVTDIPSFEELNHEQQACLIADYYALQHGQPATELTDGAHFDSGELLAHYRSVIEAVMLNPAAYTCQANDTMYDTNSDPF